MRRFTFFAIEPVITDPRAADESDLAIDNEQLAMGAVVEALERVPPDGLIPADAPAGLSQAREGSIPCRETADRIDD